MSVLGPSGARMVVASSSRFTARHTLCAQHATRSPTRWWFGVTGPLADQPAKVWVTPLSVRPISSAALCRACANDRSAVLVSAARVSHLVCTLV